MSDTSVAVIIVNYGTADLALAAVESVLGADHGPLEVSVHLVDNASPGGDAERLAQVIAARGWKGHVTLYPEATNHGFGRGNNLVIDALLRRNDPPGYIFLLNPDARLENDAIYRLWQHMTNDPDIGACGARIEDGKGNPVTAAFRFPGLVSVFSSAAAFGPVSRLFARQETALSPHLATQRVDWVAGAAVLLRTEALKETGGFDPAFFLYFEEVDLMRRMAGKGWQTWYVADARVTHEEGASTGVKSGETLRKRLPDYWYQSWRYYFQSNHGRAWSLAAAVGWGFGSAINIVTSRLRLRNPSVPLAFYSDHWAHVLRPLLRGEAVPGHSQAAPSGSHAGRGVGNGNHNPGGITFWNLVAEDFHHHGRDWFSQGFWALFWHRFGNWRMGIKSALLRPFLTLIYRIMARVTQWLCGIDLPYTVIVGRRVVLEHFGGMILVPQSIGDDVTIRQNTTLGISAILEDGGRPVIGNGVDIGAGAVILGAVHIGDNAVIGANAVVVRDVAPLTIVGGVPAKVLRHRNPAEAAVALRRRKGKTQST